MFFNKLNKLYTLFATIALIALTNSTYAQIIVNSCPATTGDLTSKVTSTAPAGTTITYHTGTPATDANKFTGDATAAPAGVYYVAYHDATNNCYSPTSTPLYVAKCVENTCPATTVDLTSSVTSTPPAGTTVTYHTGTPATDANKVADPSQAEAGTYYAAYHDATNNCYSPTSTPIVVTINECGATISGNVSADTNGDGTNDKPLPGVVIELLNADGTPVTDSSGNPITATTDASGNYSFENVPEGEYQLKQQQPTGYASTGDSQSSDGDTTANSSQTDNIIPVTVSNGETEDANNNFTEIATGSISGSVQEDTTGDDAGDTPLAGVTLELLDSNGDPVLDSSGNPITATTDANGNYTFSDVPVGTGYQVKEQDPSGYTSTTDSDGTNDNTISGISVTDGADSSNNDFVDEKATTISGNVSADTNSDGSTDTPLEGVTLELLDSNGDPVLDSSGNPVTATTDSSGNYTFSDVPAGNYQIKQQQPEGYTSMDDADGNSTENIINVDASTPGSTVAAQNFSEQKQPLPVELVSFDVIANGSNAVLSWVTSTEINNDKFVVEYSLDGENFTDLAHVSGQGTTTEESTYEYIHKNAAYLGSQLFYRLSQVDYDGTTNQEGGVQSVIFKNVDLIVYPVLVQRGQNININGGEVGTSYTIHNTVGNIMSVGVVNSSVFQLKTNDLSSGLYILNFSNGDAVKFIVK